MGARLMKDILLDQVRQGATVFLTSHVLEVVERLCDRVAIIHEGKLVLSGTMAELRTRLGNSGRCVRPRGGRRPPGRDSGLVVTLMWNQIRAIVWAQWRTLAQPSSALQHGPASSSPPVLTGRWYGSFAFLAVFAGIPLSKPEEMDAFHKILPPALLLCFLYWQVIPVLMASMGSSLDMRKLLVYPIPQQALFAIEVCCASPPASRCCFC